jgi:hypothetical protein
MLDQLAERAGREAALNIVWNTYYDMMTAREAFGAMRAKEILVHVISWLSTDGSRWQDMRTIGAMASSIREDGV